MRICIYLILSTYLISCSTMSESNKDKFIWLEEVESSQSLDWVKAQNAKTIEKYSNKPMFKKVKQDVGFILGAEDRIFYVRINGDYVYHYLQSPKSPKGIYRRASFKSYVAKNPEWETIIDIDKLSIDEKENWVWKGANCLMPDNQRCLLKLSRGGKDAVVVREFDTLTKSFVTDGFILPEAKTDVDWRDRDHLFIATDFGPDTLTSSGYARQVRLWKRGTFYKDSRLIVEANTDYVSASAATYYHPKKPLSVIQKSPSFYETEYFIYTEDDRLVRLDVPKDIVLWGVIGEKIIFETKSDWVTQKVKAGSLVSTSRLDIEKAGAVIKLDVIFTPNSKQAITDIKMSTDFLYLSLLNSVRGQIMKWQYKGNNWTYTTLSLPNAGATSVISTDLSGHRLFAEYTDFLTPPQIWYFNSQLTKKKVAELPKRFNTKNMVIEQKFAISHDGTKVPYSIVRSKKAKGPKPTLLYGYGGFEISLTPDYLAVKGKTWLESGGVYVLANLRGGGEFGPDWHTSVLKHNRQKVFDDFIAVAEALIKQGVTTAKQLGIEGYSNGGLLVGTVAMQRPDLFGAVICGAPLLDMMRYHKLLAGASWIGEYGDPDNATDASYILKYSPYQNIQADTKYPPMFIITSTKDDRVHPGHARKMAAKLMEAGAPITYYENIDGGHSTAADIDQRSMLEAYKYMFLTENLF